MTRVPLILLGFLVAWHVAPATAQDPVAKSPTMYKVLVENEHVRVMEFFARPGEKEELHSHPALIVYMLTGGYTARITASDGTSQDYVTEKGQAFWVEPTVHSFENLGPGDAHQLVVEMKMPLQNGAAQASLLSALAERLGTARP